MDWYPKASPTMFQACSRRFLLLKNSMPFAQCQMLLICVNVLCFWIFRKTPASRGTQLHTENWSNVVLYYHLDLIGDQRDVQYFPIY